jgi:hypothetical protein
MMGVYKMGNLCFIGEGWEEGGDGWNRRFGVYFREWNGDGRSSMFWEMEQLEEVEREAQNKDLVHCIPCSLLACDPYVLKKSAEGPMEVSCSPGSETGVHSICGIS